MSHAPSCLLGALTASLGVEGGRKRCNAGQPVLRTGSFLKLRVDYENHARGVAAKWRRSRQDAATRKQVGVGANRTRPRPVHYQRVDAQTGLLGPAAGRAWAEWRLGASLDDAPVRTKTSHPAAEAPFTIESGCDPRR